jgi:hypothetical protein
MEGINCMVEKYSLEKANDAYGKFFQKGRIPLLTLDHRGHDEGDSEVQRRDHDGLGCSWVCETYALLAVASESSPTAGISARHDQQTPYSMDGLNARVNRR